MHRLLAASLALAAPLALAKGKSQKAHEHGAATLDVAVDGNKIELAFESPADDVIGFEHAPKTDADKKAVTDALAKLRNDTAKLFALPAELECKATEVLVGSTQEDAMKGDPPPKGTHADVDADVTFTCKSVPAGTALKLGILDAFPKIKKLKVQVVTPTSQSGLTATSSKDVVKL